jgi:capsid protein
LIRWLRSLFTPERKPPRRTAAGLLADRYAAVKARYDAAITDESNKKHWANADGLSAAAANSHGVRDTLRRRSRYECDNGGYCAGIVRTRADDLVGTGPTLQLLTDDDALNGQVERAFAAWARASRLAEKLHTLDMARCRDGESFGVFVTNPAVKHPVQLDLKLIEADQVADPVGGPPVPGRIDGVEYDAHGNPAAYHVLRFHPGGRWFDFAVPSSLTDFSAPGPYGEPVVNFSQPYAADRIDAQYVLHWFRKDRPGQLRGVPELTPALSLFPYLRRFTLATLAAAETAADLSAILETEYNPALTGEEPEPPAPMEPLEIERGVMVTMPAGSKMHQFAAEHPNAQFADFRREIIKECGRPVGMPFNVTAADSSQHNYSSAKLDHYGYRGGLRVERSFAEAELLDGKLFPAFVAEARLIPGLLPAGVDVLALPRAWHWPGWPSMDKDEAKNDTERLNNGTATLAELQAEWGVDWKESVRQRGRELTFMAQAGVPPPPQRTTPVGGADPTEAGAPAAAAKVAAAFCPTGPGGGPDNSCPPTGGGGGGTGPGRNPEQEDPKTERERDKEDRRTQVRRDREEQAVRDRAYREVERSPEVRKEERVIDVRQTRELKELDKSQAERHDREQAAGKTSPEDRAARGEKEIAERKSLADRHDQEKADWYGKTVEPRAEKLIEERMKPVRERWAKEDKATAERRRVEDKVRVARGGADLADLFGRNGNHATAG